MKFTKKCESTRTKQTKNMDNELKKLDTKRRNKRCPSAGIFCTSSAGAVISLIFRNKIVSVASSLTLMLLFCGLIGIFSLTGATDMLGLGGSAYAADSINLNIDTNNLSLNTMSTSTTGNFATSSNMNISVSTTSENGYTLSMRSATGSTSLVNTTDSSKAINSISSSVTPTNYADDAYASANNLNNTWGYLPSKYNSAANSNFLPLPTDSAQIIETTDSANPTANTYTLSFGTRVNNETAVGSYKNDSFVIIAIANFVPLTINYNANGGYFGSSTSTTLNTVAYDATSEGGTETVTKYSHTSNINDQGVASGTYPASQATKDVVTIPGATQLNVQIYYATRSSSYAAAYAFTGEYTGSISSSTTGYLKKYTSGQGTTKETANTDTFTVTGDTVTFGFYSSYRSSRYYGYYAIVTAEVDSTTYSKTAISGSYATPNNSDSSLTFAGWTENQSGSGTVYADESEVSTKLPYVNGDPAVTLYAKWQPLEMQTMISTDCTATAKTAVDNRDNQQYIVQKLNDGKCWMLDNLRLDPASVNLSTLQGNTNASDATLNYLKNGGGTTSDKYPTAKLNNVSWTSSSQNYYSIPMTVSTYKDTVASTKYGSGSGKIGVYYNYCAASAGSYCYGNGTSGGTASGDATEDLCPAGWRMPTGGDSGEYANLFSIYGLANYRNALSTPLSGYFYSGSALQQGTIGYFWSSTYNNNISMHCSVATAQFALPTDPYDRSRANSMRCVMKSELEKVDYMQDVTAAAVSSVAEGTTATLIDKRDNQKYTVAKIGNNLWMTRNLAIGCNGSGSTYGSSISSKTLTSTDSNVSTSWSTPTATFNSSNNSETSGYTTPAMKCDSTYGAWYNYVAATAGTISGSSNSTDATKDICPAGWRLPSYSEFSGITSYTSAFSPVAGGDYTSGSLGDTSLGKWWSANAYISFRRILTYDSNGGVLGTGASIVGYAGTYVRCIRPS